MVTSFINRNSIPRATHPAYDQGESSDCTNFEAIIHSHSADGFKSDKFPSNLLWMFLTDVDNRGRLSLYTQTRITQFERSFLKDDTFRN